jgi:triosephosphate isomerase (TIM)
MNKERKLIIAGNWKMNKTVAEALDLVNDLKRELASVKEVDFGAYTGEIAAGMLKEFSVRYVILGHSERRQYQAEPDALIARKAVAAHAASLRPILCVGETLAQREANEMESVIGTQLRGSLEGITPEQMVETIVAYEPVWAIGTGRTATAAQAQEVHAFIRKEIAAAFGEAVARRVRIQYGGSVKPSNARELMHQPDVDGALVGGAALEVRSFSEIIKNSI